MTYTITADSIYKHVSVLADDSLEGRQVGEPGEWKAAQYIKIIFESAGLTPKGDNGNYFQAFEFIKRIDFGEKNHLAINGEELQLNEEFMPMRQSASGSFKFDEVVFVDYGIRVDEEDGNYNDYEGKNVSGKAVLIKRYAPPSEDNPHINFNKYSSLTSKIQTALDHDAAGIFFITPADQDDTLHTIGPSYIYPKEIPIIFLRRKGLQRLGLDLDKPEIVSATGEIELLKVRDTGYNVVGYLPTSNDTTIIIGAHYDHLGWGGPTSRYVGKEKMIHNGADDNASGTSALLELARYFSSTRKNLQHSLLFIAFSGEEAGILGSNYYAKHMTVDSGAIRMMVSMDMIGRLKEQKEGLAIFGTGTALEFKNYFESLSQDSMKMAFKEPGTGPSDHTAFYNRKIPVLHFFTGAHQDYHKPSDDIDKIDTEGIVKVAHVVADVVEHFDRHEGELTFQKTKDPMAGKRRSSFSVTLGIMPDYIAEVKGLRIDGVSPDRPGERAGLLMGDIIIKMGDIDINDIYDYMNALSKFRKGDSTVIVIERGADTLNLQVVFE
ncbi:MAG: M20/M25/M40 family metallo-hydrolase [Candidatus Zixiibacteriota bacterium]